MSWKRLLTPEERRLLKSIESESRTADWHSCNYCDATFEEGEPIRHADDCPVRVARLFACKLAGRRA